MKNEGKARKIEVKMDS